MAMEVAASQTVQPPNPLLSWDCFVSDKPFQRHLRESTKATRFRHKHDAPLLQRDVFAYLTRQHGSSTMKPGSALSFSVAPSSKGGIDIEIGSDTIHVPNHFSTDPRHPLVRMLLFAEVKWGKFHYPKSLAQESIVNMFQKPRTSDPGSPNVYEAGWVSARHQLMGPNPDFWALLRAFLDPDWGSNKPPVPVLFDMSGKNEEASSTGSATPPARDDDGSVLNRGDYFMKQSCVYNTRLTNMSSENTPPIAEPMERRTHSSTTPHEQVMVVARDSERENLHCRGTSGFISSAETDVVPMIHEIGETEGQHRDPFTIAAAEAEAEAVIAKAEEAKPSPTWVVATAASHHATGNLDFITGMEPQQDELFVHAADGTPMQVLGCGNVVTDAVVLPDVWYVPGLTANLVSVSQLAELDYSVGFGRAQCYVRDGADGRLVGSARVGDEGLFELDFLKLPLCM